jgi:SAM-dependent methyltransferase
MRETRIWHYGRSGKTFALKLTKQYIFSPIRLFRIRNQRDLKLHLGCGGNHLDGYVNIDKYPTSGADLVISAERLPLHDGCASEIFSSHMIEHIPRESLDATIKEWYRLLQFGGRIIIRCPNFELYLREWLDGGYEWRWGWGLRPIFGWEGRGKGMWHLNGFTAERLDRLMTEHGFKTLSCETTETRTFTIGTAEYRSNGDVVYVGEKST